jgi:ESS family glutamate:Na+ symporter
VYYIEFDVYQTALMGALALALGILMVRHSKLLRKYCIPAAVTGGLVFAIVACLFYEADVAEVSFDETLKNVFMMAFFCSVGFMASIKMLKKGGRLVLLLLALVGVLIVLQDVIGVGLSVALGMDSRMGLALGSISLVGGHGTAASFGPDLVDVYGVANADTVAIAAATFGLAISGFIGGPLAKRRIEKGNLRPDPDDQDLAEEDERPQEIDANRFLYALMLICIGVGAGSYIVAAIKEGGLTLPVYLGAMLVAMLIRNVADWKGIELPLKEINTLGWISLSMFLSIALMVTQLWTLGDLAGKMLIILLIQTAVVALYAYYVVFNTTGKDYESAALVTATTGFSLGATPNAMANMEALFDKYGVAPKAYFAVPLVGSVFIDLLNAVAITVFLNVL